MPRLTDRMIRALEAPATGNRITYDDELKGFGCRITAGGAKSFVLNYRAAGRERRLTIGSFPEWTAAAARARAAELRRRIDVGEDPMAARHASRVAPTVADLADRYMSEWAPRKRERSAAEDASLIRQLIVPKLGRLKVAAVKRADVEAFHREVSKETPVRANRALSLLRKMMNLAIGWELRADNPATGIDRNPEDKRDRYLTPDETQRLLKAIAAHPNQASATVIRLLLLTGARRGEVLKADWSQFDLAAGVWAKPASTTKQAKLHRVPLSAAALTILRDMQAKAAGPALFPGRGGNAHQGDLKKFWKSVCRDAGVEGVRVHDLRHSYASYLVSSGHSLPMIGSLLGHSSTSTTARYAHLFDAPQREATEKAAAFILTGERPSSDSFFTVTPLARKQRS